MKTIKNNLEVIVCFGSIFTLALVITYMSITYGVHNPIASY